MAVVLLLIAVAGFLFYLGFIKESAGDRAEIRAAISSAFSRLALVYVWEFEHEATAGSYAPLYELRESVPELNSMDVLDWVNVTRRLTVRTSADGKAYMAEVVPPESSVECATYQYAGDALASNADAPAASKIHKMNGWPDDMNGIQCRRTRFPWPLLNWTGIGSLEDEVSAVSVLR